MQAVREIIEEATTCLVSEEVCNTYHGYQGQQYAAKTLEAVGSVDTVNTLWEALSLQDTVRSEYMSGLTRSDVKHGIGRALRAIQARNPTARATALGIVFDIDDLGGGFYGAAAWRIFMRNVRLENVIGCTLKEGDTKETPRRRFCIAIFGLGAHDAAAIRLAFEKCADKGLAPLDERFLPEPWRETLVDAGLIDSRGRLVQDEWSRMFHDRCKDCGWGFAPKAVRADLTPELRAELESLRNKTVS